jgi:uncharacterized damage-inducible protein DinB
MIPMDSRYPIGKYAPKPALTPEERLAAIDQIDGAPGRLRAAVAGLAPSQLATPYRPGGWTIAQVVHHLADNDMNAFVRFKLALTESEPVIKPYDQAGWAELTDGRDAALEPSLALFDSLHRRWTQLLRAMRPEDFARALNHPERGRVTLDHMLGMYAWHDLHHIAQITALRERMGWS